MTNILDSAMKLTLLALLFLLPFTANAINVYQIGNSLTNDARIGFHFEQVARLNGQALTGNSHIRGGQSLNFIYNNPSDQSNASNELGNWQQALTNNSFDHITFQPFGTVGSTLTTDRNAILNWINLASNNSPDATYHLYAPWPGVSDTESYSEQFDRINGNDPEQPTLLNRDYFTTLFNELKALTDVRLNLIPIGEIFYDIEQLIISGEINDLTSAYDFYRDPLHTNDLGQTIIAYALYATLFDESTVGLELFPTYTDDLAFSDETALRIQQLIDYKLLAPVPVPAAIWFMVGGISVLLGRARKKQLV